MLNVPRRALLLQVSLIATLLAAVPAAQQAPSPASRTTRQPSAKPAAMTNDDVVQLVKAGFSDDLLIARINRASKAFDLSIAAMIALKKEGVSDRIIAVLLGDDDPGPSAPAHAAAKPAAPQSAATTPEVQGEHSAAARAPGIYVMGGENMILLEPTVFSGGKTGGILMSGLTMGIKKAKWKAVVRSPRAIQRVVDSMPEFIFQFEVKGSGLSSSGIGAVLGASSANEFVLARMTAGENERALVVGEFGVFGASSGTRSGDTVELRIERQEPGVYRVRPREPLEPGEYCFFYAAGASAFAATGTGKLFDFGVDSAVTRNR